MMTVPRNERCPSKRLRPCTVIALVAALQWPCAGQARSASAGLASLPTTVSFGFETVRLPQGEHMGLASGSLLFDIGNDWAVGPAVYGAASGRRGGLFVGGIELQHRWRLADGLSLATGLFAGGGGGAAAPVGGGLMLRPAVTLWKDLGPVLQGGLSWSSVRFPSGQIASQQVGVVLAWRSEFAYLTDTGSSAVAAPGASTGLGFDRIAATVTSYRFTDGSAPRIGLAGARAERRSRADGLAWGIEAAAAAKGDAAGYMEFLGTGAYSVAPLPSVLPSWRVGVRMGAGLAGGGAVPTGGGVIGKAAATMAWSPAPGWTLGGEFGALRGVRSPLRAREAQVWLGIDLEPGFDGRGDSPGTVVRTEWVGTLQHHARVERRDGTRQPLDTIGLKLNRYLGENFYLSGQAHSAYSGGAGGYSIGLFGAGLATSPRSSWRLGAEALIGAAGGGGVATAGGALMQGLVWASWAPSRRSEWRAGLGASRPLRGGGSASPIAEVSWSRAFGLAGR